MRIDRFLSQNRIIDLKSSSFSDAIGELVEVALPNFSDLQRASIKNQLLARESTMPTRIQGRIAVPHTRTDISSPFIFAIGRLKSEPSINNDEKVELVSNTTLSSAEKLPSPTPTNTTAQLNDASVKIIFLVLASKKARLFHTALSELVRELEDEDFFNRIEGAVDIKDFRQEIIQLFKGISTQTRERHQDSSANLLFGKTAERLAIGMKCNVLLFFTDTFSAPVMMDKVSGKNLKTVVVSESTYTYPADNGERPETIIVQAFSKNRMSQLRAALFIGLMREIIKPTDRVCCLGGNIDSNKLDSILILDVATEFSSVMLTHASTLIPQNVHPEVVERAISIATELVVEGREGKPIGTMLVLGNKNRIRPFVEPLILNPFNNFYSEEDRNILNPFMEETVKELALIDGAFIIDGNGVIDSAGSFITAARNGMPKPLPGGYGTRHAAACAISVAADCLAIVVSTSGQITLFRKGEAIVLMERSSSKSL